MHDINLTLLLKAPEIARSNSRLAKLIFGIQNDEIIALLVKIPVEDIRNLAKSGWICFGLRFSEALNHVNLQTRGNVVDTIHRTKRRANTTLCWD
jgi:hypothetical protein